MQAGELRERVSFFAPNERDDGYGNLVSGYLEFPDFTVAAKIEPKLGGETVLAARLQGKNLVNVTIRASIQTRQITSDWRARDEKTGDIYNIRSIIDPTQQKQWIELLCERGVA
jgi:SPP1 family predicted phage head-tail adaptor